jgi:hypothetical protein
VLFAGPYLADHELAKAKQAAATPARAWTLARHARGFNPWSEDVLAFQGRLAESTGHFSLAADLYRQAASRSLQPWVEQYRRARALRAGGRIPASRRVCRLAQAQNPLERKLTRGACAFADS